LIGITNNPESSLADLVDYVLPTDAGTEIGVAATKTFTTQLIVLLCLVLDIANRQRKTPELLAILMVELQQIAKKIADILQHQQAEIHTLAEKLAQAEHCILLGQGVNQAIALEGALKLKETTYIHAEGYAAGEFLHGSIALLDDRIPVIAILPMESTQSVVFTTAQKAKNHCSLVVGIATESLSFADYTLTIPVINEQLSPLLTVIPLQLLAYHTAVIKGLNVDRPRNITKTITSQ
jgi:glucosamine--fructose-6-phosphate aminotransferase (isomerizing)